MIFVKILIMILVFIDSPGKKVFTESIEYTVPVSRDQYKGKKIDRIKAFYGDGLNFHSLNARGKKER